MIDLTALSDIDLDALRIDLASERDRRTRAEQAPEQIAAVTRDARSVGVSEGAIRAAVETGLEGAI